MASNSLTLSDKTQLWKDCQAASYSVRRITKVDELLQTDHTVLVEVHAGEHLLHVVGLHLGVNLRPHQVVYGVGNLGGEIKYILISEDLSQSHNRDDYSQDNIWPNSISITYIFLVCYDKETEYHYWTRFYVFSVVGLVTQSVLSWIEMKGNLLIAVAAALLGC